MKKRKVLVVAASLKIGGAEKVARNLALYANPEQFEFHYIVFGPEVGAYEAELLERGCQIFHLPEPLENHFAYYRSLCRLMRTNRYDVVHAHTMFSCGWVMLAGKHCGIPVRISHSHSALRDESGWMKSVYEASMRL